MGYTNIATIIQTLNDNNVSLPIKERVENYNMLKRRKMIGNNPSINGRVN